MPSQRSLKSLFIEIVVFVSMFALLGHLSMNFWERFIIQTELSNMRTSLHSLKDTIYKIGFAYDNLHEELTGLAKKQYVPPSLAVLLKKEAETQHEQCKKPQSLDRRTVHDTQVQAMINARNRTTLTNPIFCNNKSAQILIQDKRSPKTRFIVVPEMRKPGKNIATLTRYPLKSTGTDKTNTCNDDDCYHTNYDSNHKSCKEDESFNLNNNWKF